MYKYKISLPFDVTSSCSVGVAAKCVAPSPSPASVVGKPVGLTVESANVSPSCMLLELLLPLKLLELLLPLLLPLEQDHEVPSGLEPLQDHEVPSGLEPLEPLDLLGLLVFLAADVGLTMT